ncbi:effector-associated constant component EACC1 [Streptomyces sp. NPDC000941]
MNLRIVMHGPHSGVEFRSLYKWLSRHGEELRAAGIRMGEPGTPPGPEEMGGTFEVVQFVVNALPAYGALAVAVAAWRADHEPRSGVTFERDGLKVSFDSAQSLSEESVRQALRELLGASGDDSRDSGESERGGQTGDAA